MSNPNQNSDINDTGTDLQLTILNGWVKGPGDCGASKKCIQGQR